MQHTFTFFARQKKSLFSFINCVKYVVIKYKSIIQDHILVNNKENTYTALGVLCKWTK